MPKARAFKGDITTNRSYVENGSELLFQTYVEVGFFLKKKIRVVN
jgi:hypothetical protein